MLSRPDVRVLFCGIVCVFFGLSCHGYHLKDQAPVSLAKEYRSLFIVSVENPTMKPWLDARLRASVRDEFTRRGKIQWVSKDRAAAYLKIKVHDFSSNTSVSGSKDETIKSAAGIDLEAWIVSQKDGSVLWRSNRVSAGQSFLTGGRDQAEARVLDLAVRELADRLGWDF
ncbi:MAG: LPS assembly lipoprotein LptE [Thermodesulfobacteriota bacterium]|nr:LPS assembly lipoprotein LptE [Thermodesulfobacteriota bacterium]